MRSVTTIILFFAVACAPTASIIWKRREFDDRYTGPQRSIRGGAKTSIVGQKSADFELPGNTIHRKLAHPALKLLRVHRADMDRSTFLKPVRSTGSFPSELCCSSRGCRVVAAARRLPCVTLMPSFTRAVGSALKRPRGISARSSFGSDPLEPKSALIPADTSGPLQTMIPKSSPMWLDRLEKFTDTLQNEIVTEAELEQIATIVELPVMFTDESDGRRFDFDRWASHRGPSRYARLLLGTLIGVTTRRISTTIFLLVCFSGFVAIYFEQAKIIPQLPELELPLTPFELTAPVLGLLLVFRTNTAYERFDKGSDASWELSNRMRSLMRQLTLWTSAPQVPRHEREASAELIDACCVLHGWLMGTYLRGEKETGELAEFLKLTLGEASNASNSKDALAAALTPSAAGVALSLAMMHRLPSVETAMRISMDQQLDGFTSSLGICEKLLRTPIPLGYTRYSVRFLWIWLSLLPFALVSTFSTFGDGTWWENKPKPVLCLAMAFIGFIFLSIEDIAVQIEEPFKILPLEKHQEWLLREAKQIKLLHLGQAAKDHNVMSTNANQPLHDTKNSTLGWP